MIPVRVSFWYEFIAVLTYRSVFVYMKCICLHEMADKTQLYANLGLTRAFFEALKAIHGPSYQSQAPYICSIS